MNFLSEKFLSNLFKVYLTVVLILMVIKTNGRIKLADTIWGFRGDHFVHSTIFIPYMILIGLIYRNEPLKMKITKIIAMLHTFLKEHDITYLIMLCLCHVTCQPLSLASYSVTFCIPSGMPDLLAFLWDIWFGVKTKLFSVERFDNAIIYLVKLPVSYNHIGLHSAMSDALLAGCLQYENKCSWLWIIKVYS